MVLAGIPLYSLLIKVYRNPRISFKVISVPAEWKRPKFVQYVLINPGPFTHGVTGRATVYKKACLLVLILYIPQKRFNLLDHILGDSKDNKDGPGSSEKRREWRARKVRLKKDFNANRLRMLGYPNGTSET